jgi:hypothetical protein
VTEGTREHSRVVGSLRGRAAGRLAWSVCVLSLGLTAVSLVLLSMNLSHPDTHIYDYWLENTIAALSYTPVGALIASRRPANPVGWLMCLLGLAFSIGHFSSQYAIYDLSAQPDSLPAGEAMAWISSWILPPIIGLQVFSFLLFPTGRLPSRRWRWLAWMTVACVVVGVASSAFSFGANAGLGPVQNPLGIEGLSSIYNVVLSFMSTILYVAVASSLLVRLRRARGVERQQIKWFVFGAVATIGGITLAYVIPNSLEAPPWFERTGFAVLIATTAAIPVSIGIAILRYRLYDIDRIINRTLVYGSLTAALVALYFGVIIVLQRVFVLFMGQQSTLAVVASTLLIAALFTPLRRRIQAFIDRSFYRRKYDATKTLRVFSTKLRDETDLEALSDDLVVAVRETMQPAHVTLWLRPAAEVGRSRESA